MTRTEYRGQLDALREDVVDLGELVLDRYEQALAALESGDRESAAAVIEGDRGINARYLELERDCIDLFALQQPVATDLRFVASSFKVLTDVERIGDLATNVAAVARGAPIERYADLDVVDVGRDAGEMVADALGAYDRGDTRACWRVAERDDDLDARCEAAGETVVRDLLAAGVGSNAAPGGDGETVVADAWRTLLVVRDVERVGDHAVNVAARTLYVTEHDDSLLF